MWLEGTRLGVRWGRYLVVRDRSRKRVGDPGLQALKLLEGLLLWL